MKYLIQGMAMLTDVMIIVAVMGLIYYTYTIGNMFLYFISILLLLGTYRTWKGQGGFIAWTKEGRKSFFAGWDEIKGERKC